MQHSKGDSILIFCVSSSVNLHPNPNSLLSGQMVLCNTSISITALLGGHYVEKGSSNKYSSFEAAIHQKTFMFLLIFISRYYVQEHCCLLRYCPRLLDTPGLDNETIKVLHTKHNKLNNTKCVTIPIRNTYKIGCDSNQ